MPWQANRILVIDLLSLPKVFIPVEYLDYIIACRPFIAARGKSACRSFLPANIKGRHLAWPPRASWPGKGPERAGARPVLPVISFAFVLPPFERTIPPWPDRCGRRKRFALYPVRRFAPYPPESAQSQKHSDFPPYGSYGRISV